MGKIVTITKEKLSYNLKNNLGLSHVLCEEVVSHLFKKILELGTKDGKVVIPNFGSWIVKNKSKRVGFDMHRLKSVPVDEKTVFKFIPANSLKEKVNADE